MSTVAPKHDTIQEPPDDLPLATADAILKIVVERFAKCMFRVTVTDGDLRFTARLEAKELITFGAFRQALLDRFGCWFSNEQYEGRKAKSNWSGDIEYLMQQGGSA